jgi:uncharacterized protein with beta-barrel porin domain
VVHVSSTTSEHTDEWLRHEFSQFGTVKSTFIKETGWAFVIFETPLGAKNCLDSSYEWAKEHGLRLSQYYGGKKHRR